MLYIDFVSLSLRGRDGDSLSMLIPWYECILVILNYFECRHVILVSCLEILEFVTLSNFILLSFYRGNAFYTTSLFILTLVTMQQNILQIFILQLLNKYKKDVIRNFT